VKVAIVCDWLTGIGGAERVVFALHEMYPDAPIYTSQYDPSSIDWFSEADVRTTWLQKIPKGLKKFLPLLRAYTFSRLDLSEYDLVLSSSSAEAKSVKTGPKTVHICYMHAPTHYYWIKQDEYLKNPGFPLGFNWLAKLGLRFLDKPLKEWDKHAAKKPDLIVTNSNYTKDLIMKHYKRESVVIHPPVDVDRFKLKANPPTRHGFVIAGRQTPHKRIELAVEACTDLKVPLIVIGNGPDHKRLEKKAGRNVTFLTNVNDFNMVEHFQSALGFIFPNIDEFGIVAVEALAAGTPVVAYNKGGVLDYLKPGQNGIFFDKQTPQSLARALESMNSKSFNYASISSSAQKFSADNFKDKFKSYISKVSK
jgi:glycosyltransferase involved in cell wall biosynthesis